MPNGYGYGRGMGGRKGWGRGWCWGPPPWAYGPMGHEPYPYEPTEEEMKQEIEMLKREKTDIDDEITEIEKMLKEKGGK